MSTAVQPTDLFGTPLLPIEGSHLVQVLGLERLSSPTQGQMRRLVAEIVRGPYAGCRVFKPLTEDLRGLAWLEQAALSCGLSVPPGPTSTQFDLVTAQLRRAGELVARIYHYHHPEAVFPTIRSLARRST